MHTVENAVIVPVFTLIIVALISVSGYMHDKVVMRNILNQLSIEYSRNITSNEQKALLVKSEEYIKDKTASIKIVMLEEFAKSLDYILEKYDQNLTKNEK